MLVMRAWSLVRASLSSSAERTFAFPAMSGIVTSFCAGLAHACLQQVHTLSFAILLFRTSWICKATAVVSQHDADILLNLVSPSSSSFDRDDCNCQ